MSYAAAVVLRTFTGVVLASSCQRDVVAELHGELQHFVDGQERGAEQQRQRTADVTEQRHARVGRLRCNHDVLQRRKVDLQT